MPDNKANSYYEILLLIHKRVFKYQQHFYQDATLYQHFSSHIHISTNPTTITMILYLIA